MMILAKNVIVKINYKVKEIAVSKMLHTKLHTYVHVNTEAWTYVYISEIYSGFMD